MDNWCARHGHARGAIVDMPTGHALARAWYHDRLEATWERPSAAARQSIFDGLGLTGPFWQLSG